MTQVEPTESGPLSTADFQEDTSKFVEQPVTRPVLVQKIPYVSLPRLSEEEKSLYASLIPELDETIPVDEVVGEVDDDIKGPLYYARFDQGIIMGVRVYNETRFLSVDACIFPSSLSCHLLEDIRI